jgi:hypothetical protein
MVHLSICPPCDNRRYPGFGAKFWTHLNEVQIVESDHPSSHSPFIGTDVACHISPRASVRQKVEASKEIWILSERTLLFKT